MKKKIELSGYFKPYMLEKHGIPADYDKLNSITSWPLKARAAQQCICNILYLMSKLLQTHRPVTFPTATVFPAGQSKSHGFNIY